VGAGDAKVDDVFMTAAKEGPNGLVGAGAADAVDDFGTAADEKSNSLVGFCAGEAVVNDAPNRLPDASAAELGCDDLGTTADENPTGLVDAGAIAFGVINGATYPKSTIRLFIALVCNCNAGGNIVFDADGNGGDIACSSTYVRASLRIGCITSVYKIEVNSHASPKKSFSVRPRPIVDA